MPSVCGRKIWKVNNNNIGPVRLHFTLAVWFGSVQTIKMCIYLCTLLFEFNASALKSLTKHLMLVSLNSYLNDVMKVIKLLWITCSVYYAETDWLVDCIKICFEIFAAISCADQPANQLALFLLAERTNTDKTWWLEYGTTPHHCLQVASFAT